MKSADWKQKQEREKEKMKSRLAAGMMALCLAFGIMPASVQAEDAQTTIRIVHTNDLHGYYKTTDRSIGFEALKAFIDQQDADLVLDAGDTFHGQAFATVEQGLGMAELMDAAGYDAVTPGNHDWSYGAERLKELDGEKNFAVLASNVVNENGEDFFDQNYLVKDVTADDGTKLRVGVLGVIDDAFYSSTVAENVKGLTFKEEAQEASETAKVLRETEGCDIVIAMTHQSDCAGFVSAVSGIDAVIAGHEHLLMDQSYEDSEGKNVPVVEAGYYFQNAGVMSLTYDTQSKTVTDTEETFVYLQETEGGLTAAGLRDETVAELITSIESRQAASLEQPIGYSEKEYPYSWEEIRVAEQPIGRIVTASYLDWTGADVAMENAGGIRGGIPQGDVTYGDLIAISPYGNMLVLKEMTGQQILDVVEYSIELSRQCDEIYTLQKEAVAAGEDPYQYSWPEDSGSVLQFGGIQLEYDLSAAQGSRLSNVMIGGSPVDPEKVYTVAMNNYVSENTDYPHISGLPVLTEYGTCEEALKRYIEKGTFKEAAETPGLVPVQGGGGNPGGEDPDGEDPEGTNPDEEKPSSGDPTGDPSVKPSEDVQPTSTDVRKQNPKTGDENTVWPWMAAAVLAVGVSGGIAVWRRREKIK